MQTPDWVTWQGEYSPTTWLGSLRFVLESVFALAIIIRGACHVHGVFHYHRDRSDWARSEMDARYRLVRFAVEEPIVPPADELMIRLATAWLGVVLALAISSFATIGVGSPVATVIAAGNVAVLVLDPVWWALTNPDHVRTLKPEVTNQ